MQITQLNEIEFLEWLKKTDKYISQFNDLLDGDISDILTTNTLPFDQDLVITKKLGKVSYGTLYMCKGRHFGKSVPVLVAADNNGIISVIVELVKYGKASYRVDLTIAREENTFPAHKVYASFVKMGHILVSGEQQSAGGQMIWRRLAKEPGINVYGWDTLKKKPVNLGDDVEDDSLTHASEQEIAGRMRGLKLKMKDKTISPKQKQKIKKEYMDELTDLAYIKKKIMLVATAK